LIDNMCSANAFINYGYVLKFQAKHEFTPDVSCEAVTCLVFRVGCSPSTSVQTPIFKSAYRWSSSSSDWWCCHPKEQCRIEATEIEEERNQSSAVNC